MTGHYYHEASFVPSFPVEDRHRRVLIGLVVGAVEKPDVNQWSVEDTWIDTHLSDDYETIRALFENGWVWGRQWPNGTASVGLTDQALAWVRDAYGMPRGDASEVADWVALVLEPQFRPESSEATPIVLELVYSPTEARDAHAMLDRVTARGNASAEAIDAYRAHVGHHTLRRVH